jgi:uncharacterized protein YbjT (DUF2867 family)
LVINDVLVLGGSGFVGRHLCHQLAARGYRLTIPTRDRERAKRTLITLPTADVLTADVRDTDTLIRLARGCGAVINLVGVLHNGRGKRSFGEAHVELARKVVDVCRRAGVQRLLHMSALNASPDAPSAYLRSKGEAEQIVRESGLDYTIFRPSVIFGREDSFLNTFAGIQRMLPLVVLAMPDARFQPVFVQDVAAVFAESLTRLETFGQRYDLAGPKAYTLRELVRYVGELTGHRRPIIGLGPQLSRVQGTLMGLSPVKLLTRDNVASMTLDSVTQSPLPFGIAATPLEAVAPAWLAHRTPRERYNRFRDRATRVAASEKP